MEERSYMRGFKNSKFKTYSIGAVVVIAVIALIFVFKPFSSNNNSQASSGNKAVIKDALATQAINQEFKFPLKDDKGAIMGEIKYVIENAELRDEIVVKGKKASAVAGKTFLILNIKITNETNQNISMNTKDYVRLFTNGNENEPLSPSIHNDPVVVDAISVKPTRVGFAINEADTNLKVKIGEIKGEKQTIDLTFNK